MPEPVVAPVQPQQQQPAAPAQAPAAQGVDLASIRAQLAAELRPTIAAEVEGVHKAALAKELGSVQARHAEDLALSDAGIRDGLGRAAVRAAWDATPKAERGDAASAADWWSKTTAAHAAHAADPEKAAAPKVHPTLAAYLPKVEAAPQPQTSRQIGGVARPQSGPQSVDANAQRGNNAQPWANVKPGTSPTDFLKSLQSPR